MGVSVVSVPRWSLDTHEYTHMCGPNNCVERTARYRVLTLHDGTRFGRSKRNEGWHQLHALEVACKKYGLTIEEWAQMYQDQDGVCAICEKPETRAHNGIVTRLSVDHDHETGAVRGLLCDACNTSIGRVNDDPNLLWKAMEYLIRHGRDLGSQA